MSYSDFKYISEQLRGWEKSFNFNVYSEKPYKIKMYRTYKKFFKYFQPKLN